MQKEEVAQILGKVFRTETHVGQLGIPWSSTTFPCAWTDLVVNNPNIKGAKIKVRVLVGKREGTTSWNIRVNTETYPHGCYTGRPLFKLRGDWSIENRSEVLLDPLTFIKENLASELRGPSRKSYASILNASGAVFGKSDLGAGSVDGSIQITPKNGPWVWSITAIHDNRRKVWVIESQGLAHSYDSIVWVPGVKAALLAEFERRRKLILSRVRLALEELE